MSGLKPIETIAVGDQVWAYDHKQLCWAEREVVEVYRLLHRGTMATIQVKGETLRAPGGHPFWVVRGNNLSERQLPVRIKAYEVEGQQEGRWVLARDLRPGDEVLLRDCRVVALEAVRLDEVEETVYNFHVAELQNYAVSESGILVHNTNDPALTPTQRECLASLERLQQLRARLARAEDLYQRAMTSNSFPIRRMVSDAYNNILREIEREQLFFDFLTGGLP